MRAPLERTWEVMPEPKALVAVGTDACSGGLAAAGELTAGGVDAVLPVDVYVPGSPPPPIAILHGLLLAVGLLARGRRPHDGRCSRSRWALLLAGAVRALRVTRARVPPRACATGGVLLVIVGLDRGARRRASGARSRRLAGVRPDRRCAPTALAGDLPRAHRRHRPRRRRSAALELPARAMADGAGLRAACSLSPSRSARTTRFCSSSPGRPSPSAST